MSRGAYKMLTFVLALFVSFSVTNSRWSLVAIGVIYFVAASVDYAVTYRHEESNR